MRPGERSATSSETAAVAAERDQPPQHLLDPEVVDGHRQVRALEPAPDRRVAAEDPLQRVRRRGEHRPEQGAEGAGLPRGTDRRPVGLREVAHVGQHPHGELRAAEHEDPGGHHQQAGPDPGAAQRTPGGRAHDSTRRSVGSRPMRTIVR